METYLGPESNPYDGYGKDAITGIILMADDSRTCQWT